MQAAASQPVAQGTLATVDASVAEHAPGGAVVATLSVLGSAGETAERLITSSAKFELIGTQVQVATDVTLGYRPIAAHAIALTVAASDEVSRTVGVASQDGAPVSEVVSAAVARNEAPVDITVAGGSVEENAAAGTVVATLAALDPNAGDTFSYALTSDPSGYFEVVGNEVLVKASANVDYETATSHDITVTVTDGGGLRYSEVISIAIINQSGTIVGTPGNDVLTGTAEEDVISGLAGDDTLYSGAGNDVLLGGPGNDTYIIDSSGDVVTELAGEGTDLIQSSVSYTLDANVENLTLTGTGNIDGTGNTLNNILIGNSGNNILSGGSGNDVLDGGAGNDTMAGGTGNDTYVVDSAGDVVTEGANAGTDTVQSSISYTLGANVENLTLTGSGNIDGTGNTLANTLTGNSGNNILDGGSGNDTMLGGAGDDTYVVDSASDVVTEGTNAGTDTVLSSVTYTLAANVENLTLTGTGNINATGNTLDNTLTGNAGNNTLSGGAGNDTMLGGAGNDTYVVDAAGDVVTELAGQGTDLVQSSISYVLGDNVENLTLTGTGVIDGTGNALDNTLTGNSGANILDGGSGNDTMVGGSGNDTYVVDSAGDVATESSNSGGTDTVLSSITYTLGSNVENLTLTGSDNINATGNTLANTLTGNAGDNILSGGSGNDTMVGGSGNDTYVVDAAGDVVTELPGQGTDTVQSSVSYTLSADVENLTLTGTGNLNATGNALANTLTGNSGANILSGGSGNDTMVGGAGNDTYVVDAAGDVVTEAAGEGTDLVQSSVNYTLSDNVENLTLTGTGNINATGNTLNNTLTGNAGNNILDGGAGNDTMVGGAGDDTYVVDSSSDVVTEGTNAGTDTVLSSITYTLGSNVENLTLTGSGNINGTGNTGNNTLTGNAGDNTLNGGTGNDTMLGGAGNDTLIGGSGDDLFVYASGHGSDSVNGGTGTWIDAIALDQSGGPLQLGTDWTVHLTSGSILQQTQNELTFSSDADGTLNFTDGSTIAFTDIERVQW